MTKIARGWRKLWANIRALIGILSHGVGPSLAIWANLVQFSFQPESAAARTGRLDALPDVGRQQVLPLQRERR